MKVNDTRQSCAVCGRTFSLGNLILGASVRDVIAEEIRRDHPAWSAQRYICQPDLMNYRARYVSRLLESEKGEMTALENEVVESIRNQELLAKNVDSEFEQQWTFGEKLADRIASFGGSWAFLVYFAGFMSLWIVMNSLVLLWKPMDPYPFILLNLMLSCLAAIQAPVIMMSQNRQEAKDRVRAQHDYQVNLKAELEIRHLNEKMDHLLSHQWARLARIQEVQLDILGEIGRKKGVPRGG